VDINKVYYVNKSKDKESRMSSAPLRVFLSAKEDEKLWKITKKPTIKPRVRIRAEILRLSSQGWKVEKIAEYQKCSTATVRRTIHRWKSEGLEGLEDKSRPGRKPKWQEEDLEKLEEKLDTEERSYNSSQLCEILKKEREIQLSERQMRRILRKKNYLWKRTRKSTKDRQNHQVREIKKADLDMLEWSAAAGDICLKYLDESGFSLWSEVLYSWIKRGEQKRIEQGKKKGKRLNVCGLLEVGKSFNYGMTLKTFKSETYIQLMNWEAEQAEVKLKETEKITVVVQDQGSSHVSKLSKEQYKRWEEKGLYVFLLPSYSPELNRIEDEWQRLKEDELAGRIFEDEYELVIAVIEAIESRGEKKGLEVTRFRFNTPQISQNSIPLLS
jgi:transposase